MGIDVDWAAKATDKWVAGERADMTFLGASTCCGVMLAGELLLAAHRLTYLRAHGANEGALDVAWGAYLQASRGYGWGLLNGECKVGQATVDFVAWVPFPDEEKTSDGAESVGADLATEPEVVKSGTCGKRHENMEAESGTADGVPGVGG